MQRQRDDVNVRLSVGRKYAISQKGKFIIYGIRCVQQRTFGVFSSVNGSPARNKSDERVCEFSDTFSRRINAPYRLYTNSRFRLNTHPPTPPPPPFVSEVQKLTRSEMRRIPLTIRIVIDVYLDVKCTR